MRCLGALATHAAAKTDTSGSHFYNGNLGKGGNVDILIAGSGTDPPIAVRSQVLVIVYLSPPIP
jgi:hypothetical protein